MTEAGVLFVKNKINIELLNINIDTWFHKYNLIKYISILFI